MILRMHRSRNALTMTGSCNVADIEELYCPATHCSKRVPPWLSPAGVAPHSLVPCHEKLLHDRVVKPLPVVQYQWFIVGRGMHKWTTLVSTHIVWVCHEVHMHACECMRHMCSQNSVNGKLANPRQGAPVCTPLQLTLLASHGSQKAAASSTAAWSAT